MPAQRRKSPFTRTGYVFTVFTSRPGRLPFAILSAGPGRQLELTVQESDGTERTRLLPYSSMPNLVHHGLFSYELAAGRYKPFHGIDRDRIASGRVRSRGELPAGHRVCRAAARGALFQPVAGFGANLGRWGRFPQMSARLAIRKRRRRNGARCGVCAMPKRSLRPKPASPLSSSGIHVMNNTGRWKKNHASGAAEIRLGR